MFLDLRRPGKRLCGAITITFVKPIETEVPCGSAEKNSRRP
jgi:hypothetical protein